MNYVLGLSIVILHYQSANITFTGSHCCSIKFQFYIYYINPNPPPSSDTRHPTDQGADGGITMTGGGGGGHLSTCQSKDSLTKLVLYGCMAAIVCIVCVCMGLHYLLSQFMALFTVWGCAAIFLHVSLNLQKKCYLTQQESM